MNLLTTLREIVGNSHVLVEPADTDPYLLDWRKRHNAYSIHYIFDWGEALRNLISQIME